MSGLFYRTPPKRLGQSLEARFGLLTGGHWKPPLPHYEDCLQTLGDLDSLSSSAIFVPVVPHSLMTTLTHRLPCLTEHHIPVRQADTSTEKKTGGPDSHRHTGLPRFSTNLRSLLRFRINSRTIFCPRGVCPGRFYIRANQEVLHTLAQTSPRYHGPSPPHLLGLSEQSEKEAAAEFRLARDFVAFYHP